jgi:hypothetical protein
MMRRREIAATSTLFGIRTWGLRLVALTVLLAAMTSTHAQGPQRKRLILKDGTYQLVLSYTVSGDVVHYRSAERNGETEDIPLALVDLPATEKWAREHGPGTAHASDSQRTPVLSPELAKEEADRAARTPEVARDLRLPEQTSVLVLDTFNSTPELVPMAQEGGDLNKETAHNVLKTEINPASSPHRLLDIPGVRADVQVHVATPVFYLRLGIEDAEETDSGAITVDTHGASGRATPAGSADTSSYVLERLDVRGDIRVLNSFRIKLLGSKPQPDVLEVSTQPLPGGHWLQLTPVKPLEPGEYALVEVLSSHEINLGIWDFGMHPAARENEEAIRPEPKKPARLERRDKN